jgi:putative flippase GtrA
LIETLEEVYNHDTLPLPLIEQEEQRKPLPLWKRWPGEIVRFGAVGVLNTVLDLLVLNCLLWLFPTTDPFTVVLFNSIAYALGAVNSFLLNKYWTFGLSKQVTWREVSRFIITTALGIVCNDVLLWLANILLHPLIMHSSLWVNASKLVSIAGTVIVSYVGMRLWVFVHHPVETPNHIKVNEGK